MVKPQGWPSTRSTSPVSSSLADPGDNRDPQALCPTPKGRNDRRHRHHGRSVANTGDANRGKVRASAVMGVASLGPGNIYIADTGQPQDSARSHN